MDANGLRSFALSLNAGLQAWPLAGAASVEAGDDHLIASLRLASRRAATRMRERAGSAAGIVLAPALARDAAGNYVAWDAAEETLYSVSHLAASAGLEPVPIALPDEAKPVRDLAVSAEDVLYVAGGVGIWLADLRRRFDPVLLAPPASHPGFVVQRLAAHPQAGVWALDGSAGLLARVDGLPLFETGVDLSKERNDRFEASDANPRPPRLRVLAATLDAGERAVGLACGPDGELAVLTVGRSAPGAQLRLLGAAGLWSPPVELAEPRLPHAVGWLDAERIAVMTDAVALSEAGAELPAREIGAFVYRFDAARRERLREGDAGAPLQALGDFYPLAQRTPGPFANCVPGARTRLFYPRVSRFGFAEPVPVARISTASRVVHGLGANFDADRIAGATVRNALGVVDTRDAATDWHRLYVEGAVPANTAMILWLAANDAGPPAFDPASPQARPGWFPHLVGEAGALPPALRAELPRGTPRAVWVKDASEVAGGEGLFGCQREKGRAGLFTVLIQRAGLAVRTLRGRRLWVVAELFGDGRATPELVVLRAYAGRVSYRDRHLPALYREQLAGAEAERRAGATGADYLERFIQLFESQFTPLEDRIAGAHLLTDARRCPSAALPWLSSWVGLDQEPGTGETVARSRLANAPQLARRHGTLAGFKLALDIATDAGVTRGRIVVVENYRLRRTLATILGAHLVDYADPLTAGIAVSGNSFVGDSLFLGEENAKTFLALFRDLRSDPKAGDALAKAQSDEREAALHALYDGLAQRVTVLVHEAADADEFGLVERVAQAEAPAHVLVSVVAARYPFLVAVAALVGADTYLREPEPTRPVRVGASQLGYVDTLQGLGSLDAHGGPFAPLPPTPPEPPVADAGPDRSLAFGEGFTLDGSASRAAPGRELSLFSWTHHPGDE